LRKCFYAGTNFGRRVPTELKDYFASHGVELYTNQSEKDLNETELIEALKGMEAVLAGIEQYTEKVLAAAPQLKIIARMGVGYDNVDVPAATKRGIYVTWTPIPDFAYAEAEHTFALLLSFTHKIPLMNRDVRDGKWDSEKWGVLLEDIYHLTLGVIGLGRIGSEVARRAIAFYMRVLYYDTMRRPDLEENLGVKFVSMEELLEASDIISIHVPLTSETRNLINADAISRMKRTALIINIARGPIIDERALEKALREERIAGACLDVLSEEPPGEGNPFYKLKDELPNLILSPHVGYGPYTGRLMSMVAADDIIRVLKNEKPKYLINSDLLKVPGL
jgi:lactate dehydrogenase-like 2-hydroxyacid dehydrogenase